MICPHEAHLDPRIDWWHRYTNKNWNVCLLDISNAVNSQTETKRNISQHLYFTASLDQEVASPAQLSSMIGDEGDYPVSKTEYDSLYNEYAQLLVKERSGHIGTCLVNWPRAKKLIWADALWQDVRLSRLYSCGGSSFPFGRDLPKRTFWVSTSLRRAGNLGS